MYQFESLLTAASQLQLTKALEPKCPANPPSFSKQRYCSLTNFLLDSTNAAVSLYKVLTFLVDVDVPLPLQSSQRSVNEQLSESGVLQRCTKRREGREGRGWEGRGGEGRRGGQW